MKHLEISLQKQGHTWHQDDFASDLSPAERIAQVWLLTKQQAALHPELKATVSKPLQKQITEKVRHDSQP